MAEKSGMDKVLGWFKKKGITDKEHGIVKKLNKYLEIYSLEEDDLPDHYGMYWKKNDKDGILADLEETISDPHKQERFEDMLRLMQDSKTFDEIRQFMLINYETDEHIEMDQKDVYGLYRFKKVTLPTNWKSFFHPDLLDDITHDYIRWHGKFDSKDQLHLNNRIMGIFRALGHSKGDIRSFKAEAEKKRRSEKAEKTRAKREKAKAKKAARKGKRKKKEKRPEPEKKNKIELPMFSSTSKPPLLVESRPTKRFSGIPLLEEDPDEVILDFKQMICRRMKPDSLRKRMERHTGKRGKELDKILNEYGCQILEEKLNQSTTMVPGVLDIVSAEAADDCVRDFVRQNTNFKKGRIAGLAATQSTLKKVLRMSNEEVDSLVYDHVAEYMAEKGIDAVEKETAKVQDTKPKTMKKGYRLGITDHALQRAGERANVQTKQEVSKMFRSSGVTIPDMFNESPSNRRIVRWNGKMLTMIFLTDLPQKQYILKTIRSAKPRESQLYRRHTR